MTGRFMIGLVALLVCGPVDASDIVERAEATELRRSSGEVVPRVHRDDEGNVDRLMLTDMELTSEELAQLGQLSHLRALVLFGTDVVDDDLIALRECDRLEYLNLVGTEVTDRCIDTILEMKSLQAVCLGDVRVTPAGIERLKERNRHSPRERQLRWGYAPRVQ